MKGKQGRRLQWPIMLLAIVQMLSLASAARRHSSLYHHQEGKTQKSLNSEWEQRQVALDEEKLMSEEGHGDVFKGVSALGSRPPSCLHKCGRCIPCEAIQVPTTSDRLEAQYANYEPEGWKCKCGSSFYNP